MKTTTQNPNKKNTKHGLLSSPEQLTTKTRANIDFKRRMMNRQLNTNSLLELLRSEKPNFYELAEVVGKWVWVAFSDKQPIEITRSLAELGFHWNNTRQTWQHPCGTIPFERATYDPRERYGSYFASQQKAA